MNNGRNGNGLAELKKRFWRAPDQPWANSFCSNVADQHEVVDHAASDAFCPKQIGNLRRVHDLLLAEAISSMLRVEIKGNVA